MGTSWTNICKGNPLRPPQAGEAILGRSHFKRQHPRCFVFPCSLNFSSIPLSPPRRSHLWFQALLSFSIVLSVTVLRWKNCIPLCLATTHTPGPQVTLTLYGVHSQPTHLLCFLACRVFLFIDERVPLNNEVYRWGVTSKAILYPF